MNVSDASARLGSNDEAITHSSHWGAYSVVRSAGGTRIHPHQSDPSPSPLLRNLKSSLTASVRIGHPMVRAGWLQNGAGPTDRRGRDVFVPVSWTEAASLVADELRRVIDLHGPGSIFGGSYGWSSAGRFHHAQSQLHRFLNSLGGYVRSVGTYSAAAALIIMPRVLASYEDVSIRQMTWPEIEKNTDILLAFGGMAPKNSQVASGGNSNHVVPGALARASARGMEAVLISPLNSDFPEGLPRTWLPVKPGTDTALMLALVHTLVAAGHYDQGFVDRYCIGFAPFRDYCFGVQDGVVKDAAWASQICGISSETIQALANRLVGRRVLVTVSQSLQRGERGEQPVWAAIALAAVLGQIGLEGGGFLYGLGSMGSIGKPPVAVRLPTLPQGTNGVSDFIPVARIADMLLNPGTPFDFNGKRLVYPDIRLVYWAGGNPFHHHQDINRLRAAFGRPDTVVVHDSVWTATARHADIVLPATTSAEREDIGAAPTDSLLVAMQPYEKPWREARDDYEIFSAIAKRLGAGERFTEGRTSRDWIQHLYETTRSELRALGREAPGFNSFWANGEIDLPIRDPEGGLLRRFRRDPDAHPLPTPSGRIELFSSTIAGFGYADCPGHPTWLPPLDGAGSKAHEKYPLLLVSNNPATRLHSQLDFGDFSVSAKVDGRELARMNPADAQSRGIRPGDIVRIANDRGACLAAIALDEAVTPGVVQLSTGAWYDPDDAESDAPLCRHGNPNVLTRDAGTSCLGQGCSGVVTCVEVIRMGDPAPKVRVFEPPPVVPRRPSVSRSAAAANAQTSVRAPERKQ